MSFLYPQLFYGMVALAIPIIIHLFDFRRTRKVYFSNTRFLHQVKESTKSLYSLKHLLILISRLLFIFFLVVTFSQPSIKTGNEAALTSLHVGIYVDNSMSMSNVVSEDQSGLDASKQLAIEIINLYPTDAEFRLETSDKQSAGFYKNKSESISFIESIGIGATSKTMESVLSRLTDETLVQRPDDIYIISDFQKSTFGKHLTNLDSAIRYHLLPVGFPDYSNVYVDTMFIVNPFELDRDKLALKLNLKNNGISSKESVTVKVFLNDNQVSVTTINIKPNGHTVVDFNLGFDLLMSNQGMVNVGDFPVSFDNNFYFTINFEDRLRIVELKGDINNDYISFVYGNTELFNFSSQPVTNIDFATLESAEIIILNGIKILGQNLSNRLTKSRSNGTIIMVIPSPDPDLVSFKGLLPALVGLSADNTKLKLSPPDFNRPFFSNIVQDKKSRINMPVGAAVWNWGTDRNAYLKFIDGRPFLSEVYNNFFVLACPLDDSLTNFQTHALFVPTMYRIASQGGFLNQTLYHRLSEKEINLRVDSLKPNDIIKLKSKKIEIVPDQRIRNHEVGLNLPGNLLYADNYEVDVNDVVRTFIALNSDRAESELSPFQNENLATQFGSGSNVEQFISSDPGEVAANLNAKYKGISLWRHFLALSLLFLLAEALLIRFL